MAVFNLEDVNAASQLSARTEYGYKRSEKAFERFRKGFKRFTCDLK